MEDLFFKAFLQELGIPYEPVKDEGFELYLLLADRNEKDWLSASERFDEKYRPRFLEALRQRQNRLLKAVTLKNVRLWLDNVPISRELAERMRTSSIPSEEIFDIPERTLRSILWNVHNASFRDEMAFITVLKALR